MKQMRLFFLSTVLLITSLPLYAQRITLEESIEAAITNYPTLASRVAALKAAKAGMRQVKDNRLPNLRLHDQVQLGTANGLPGSYFSLGLIVPTSASIRPGNTMDLATGNVALAMMDWEVFNFGRYQAEQRNARADIAVSEAELERERFMLRQAVINTYLDVLRLRQFSQIEQKNISRAETTLGIIANLVRSGIKPGLDTSLAVAELSKARLGYWQVQEEYRQARINLATLTGISPAELRIDTTFRPEILLTPLEARPVPGFTQHPVLGYRHRLVNRQLSEIELIRKSAMPKLSVLGATWMRGSSIDYEDHYGPLASGLMYRRYNFLVGVAATFGVFDVRKANSRKAVQQYRVEEAEQQLALERLQLDNNLMVADSLLAVMRQELREIPIAVRAANEVYNQRMTLYNNGLENIIGLTDALRLLYSSEKDYVEARNKAAKLLLQRAFATNSFDAFYELFRP